MTIKNVLLIFPFLIIYLLNEVISAEEIGEGLVSFDLAGSSEAYFISFGLARKGSQYVLKLDQLKEKIILNYKVLTSLKFVPTVGQTECKIQTQKSTLDGYEILTDIYLENKLNVTMKMYAVKEGGHLISPELGFGLPSKFEDEANSFTHTLKKKNMIKKISYTLCPDYEFSRIGRLVFGGVPPQILRDYKNSGSCRVRRDSVSWACDVRVKTGNVFYNKGEKILSHFDSKTLDIKVPKEFMTFLEKEYFKDFLTSGDCKRITDNSTIDFFSCQRQALEQLDDLTFYFDDFKVSFKSTEIFIPGQTFCFSRFSSSILKEDFSFGISFLKHFISNFDYESQTVTLYSHHREIIALHPRFEVRTLYMSCIVVLFLGLVAQVVGGYFKK